MPLTREKDTVYSALDTVVALRAYCDEKAFKRDELVSVLRYSTAVYGLSVAGCVFSFNLPTINGSTFDNCIATLYTAVKRNTLTFSQIWER